MTIKDYKFDRDDLVKEIKSCSEWAGKLSRICNQQSAEGCLAMGLAAKLSKLHWDAFLVEETAEVIDDNQNL